MHGLIERLGLLIEDGRWITYQSRSVFIADKDVEKSLDDLHPGKAPKPKITIFKRKDGSLGERKTYPDAWIAKASKFKFERVSRVMRDSEEITEGLKADMNNPKKQKADRATAAALLLIQKTGMRPGGGGMTKGKPTYGASNIQKRHVKVDGDKISFRYRGKSGVQRSVTLRDAELAKVIGGYLADPGGKTSSLWPRGVSRGSLGDRMHKFDKHYKTKDLRTAVAMTTASEILDKASRKRWPKKTKAEAKRSAKALIDLISTTVSKKLGNKPATARKSYIAPEVFEYALKKTKLADAI